MKAQIEPGWLVSLMCRWAKRQLAGETGALGYPRKAIGFSHKTTGGYNHSIPCDFHAGDFADLEIALKALQNHNLPQFVTIQMYYKPWTVNAAKEEGYSFGNSTYYKRLHAAHSFVATQLMDMKRQVEYSGLNVA